MFFSSIKTKSNKPDLGHLELQRLLPGAEVGEVARGARLGAVVERERRRRREGVQRGGVGAAAGAQRRRHAAPHTARLRLELAPQCQRAHRYPFYSFVFTLCLY